MRWIALALCLVSTASVAGILYVDTGGSATNSGSTDQNSANLTGTAATVAASVVTLDGSPDLSGVVTSGAAQSTIYINDATNSTQKIFWITAFDDTLNTVTVSVAPTGVTSSSWAIGGRIIHTPANVESALRAGDIYQFNNSPATATATYFTARTSGDSTSGPITMRGKSGVRPVLNVTNNSIVLTGNAQTNWLIENLELDQDGASGNVISGFDDGTVYRNLKIVDGGNNGIVVTSANGVLVSLCEITGLAGSGITLTDVQAAVYGNYIHDNTVNGISVTNSNGRLLAVNNIIDSNGGRGIHLNAAPTTAAGQTIIGNTIYGNGDSGLEVADADFHVVLINNIFEANGNAAGEYNVEWVAGTAEITGAHSYNVFFLGAGSNNLLNLTTNSTESTADPEFTDKANGNFAISATGSAKATGYPGVFLGGSTGYMDMGSVQRQEPAAGGPACRNSIITGGNCISP